MSPITTLPDDDDDACVGTIVASSYTNGGSLGCG